MFRLSALPLIGILMLFFVPVLSLNATNTDEPASRKVGWYKVPYRGTTTVLYSCISTIFACTYTSLHLNVPSPLDGKWTKLLRKAKWMVLTILFPEFAFAKAICELQMATEDWCGLKAASDKGFFNWTFSDSKIIPTVHGIFEYFLSENRGIKTNDRRGTTGTNKADPGTSDTSSLSMSKFAPSSSSLQVHQHKSKEWTLAHCYFANMGGFVLLQNVSGFGWYHFVTAHGLLKCCLLRDINALSEVRLSEMEITDKAKADAFVKVVAIFQSSWLIVTICTRVGRELPVSQLEVCTVAFAVLTFATYLANWSKPKDVEVPIYIPYKEDLDCNDFDHYGDCFVHRSLEPTITKRATRLNTFRIRNDELRSHGQDGQFHVLTWSLSLSTLVFGAIHCAAWRTDFPSSVEKIIWLAASVASAALPLLNLSFSVLTRWWLLRRIRHYERAMRTDVCINQPPDVNWSQKSLGEGKVVTVRPGCESSMKSFHEHDIWRQLDTVDEVFWQLRYRGEMDYTISHLWLSLKAMHRELEKDGLYLTYNPELVDDPVPSPFPAHEFRHEAGTRCTQTTINLLNDLSDRTSEYISKFRRLRHDADLISTMFTWVSWGVYTLARITIIVLAFTALRSQDERLYIDTWTKYLPSIG